MTGRAGSSRLRKFLRVGWLAKGGLFVIVGVLAISLAQQKYGATDADERGALTSLADRPAGIVLVTAVSFGLLGYAGWQIWSVFRSHDGALGQLQRIGTLGLSLSYSALAIDGLRIAWTSPRRQSDDGSPTSPEGLTDRVMDLPGGVLLVILIGLGIGAVGVYHLRKGIRGDFLDDIDTAGIDESWGRALRVVGTAGFVGRAAVLGLASWLFIDAAIQHEPDRAAGMDQSLRELLDAPGGNWLLVGTGAALICAGMYDAASFRRQRIG